MTTHDDYMKKLSPARRARIAARTQQLIAEELTLRDLRKALRMSQETVAELLGMRQGDLSKFERRSDAYLSTIRRYVEAMGGTLDLVAQFPDRPPVRLMNIGLLDDSEQDDSEQQRLPGRLRRPLLQPGKPKAARAHDKIVLPDS